MGVTIYLKKWYTTHMDNERKEGGLPHNSSSEDLNPTQTISFPRRGDDWHDYRILVFKQLADGESTMSRDKFDKIKDCGLTQLFRATSFLTSKELLVDAKQVNPPDMILRFDASVEQKPSVVRITPTEGKEFDLDASEIITRFAKNQDPEPLTAIRSDTDEEVTFENVFVGLRLFDSGGNEAVIYVINKPKEGSESIDGENSGVVIEYQSNGQNKRDFYSYGQEQIDTPRVVGPWQISSNIAP